MNNIETAFEALGDVIKNRDMDIYVLKLKIKDLEKEIKELKEQKTIFDCKEK